jgi:Xaa-Pro dipeptidase
MMTNEFAGCVPTLQACSDNFRWNEREVSTRELYLDKLRELEMKPISFIGHGIGLHLHEDPYLGPTSDQPLEAGMVLGVEPLVTDTGYRFGMQNKDAVTITEAGCELLSDYTNTDTLIIVK